MAGRPENPVDRSVPARAALADFLRARRARIGITYTDMAGDTQLSAATLKRAASGKEVPKLQTVRAYILATDNFEHAGALDAALKRGELLWTRARRTTAPYEVYRAPEPQLIATVADLSRALRDLHLWAGAPSAHAMEYQAGNNNVLPHSTAHRIIQGRTIPSYREQLIGFLRACGVPEEEHKIWINAWRSAHRLFTPTRQRTANRPTPTARQTIPLAYVA